MSDWKLVPTYPTQAMDDAGERAVCDSYDSGPSMVAFRAYVAMVEAAPEAPPKINPMHEAAPDLLAALKPFIERNSSDEFLTITVRTSDVSRARAAIAKATGAT